MLNRLRPQRLRRYTSMRPLSVRSESTWPIVSHRGAMRSARPPVATTGHSPPISPHARFTRPSIIAAWPSRSPAWTDSRVLVPMTFVGGSRSTFASRAARAKSASALVSIPGAMAPPRYARCCRRRRALCRRSEIDDDDRSPKRLERRDSVHDPVCPDLVRIVVPDRHARLEARSDDHRLRAGGTQDISSY